MADEDTRHRVPREEAAQVLGVPLWDFEEAVRTGDVPSVRSGDTIEVPMEWFTQAQANRDMLPPWLRARIGDVPPAPDEPAPEPAPEPVANEAAVGETVPVSEGAEGVIQ